MKSVIIPAYLNEGDIIGIICPSGYMSFEKAETCLNVLQQWGYKMRIGKTLGHQYNYFSGTDKERLNDLQMMLDDNKVKAVFCARGGYGISRIIDAIDFTQFKENPKWIIGYSDISILHAHIFSCFNIASVHSPMASAFNNGGFENDFVQSLKKILCGEKMKYTCDTHFSNRYGKATGELVGGNLSLLAHLIGTPSEINTKNKILFLEDVGEYIYNIDRLMMQLKRSGKLQHLAALIVGGFTELKDTKIPFGQEIYDLIFDKVKEYDYPVCFDFPVSHTERNFAMKVGVKHQLIVSKEQVSLIEV